MEAGGGTDYGLRRITGDEPPLRDGRVMGGEDGGERRRAEEEGKSQSDGGSVEGPSAATHIPPVLSRMTSAQGAGHHDGHSPPPPLMSPSHS